MTEKYYNKAIKALDLKFGNQNKYSNSEFIGFSDTEIIAIKAKALELYRLEDVKIIEALFTKMSSALLSRTSSLDGVAKRRYTEAGTAVQTRMYDLNLFAAAQGIIEPRPLSEKERYAILITVKYNDLLIKVCDKLTALALAGEDWRTLYNIGAALTMNPADLTEEAVVELKTTFGIQ